MLLSIRVNLSDFLTFHITLICKMGVMGFISEGCGRWLQMEVSSFGGVEFTATVYFAAGSFSYYNCLLKILVIQSKEFFNASTYWAFTVLQCSIPMLRTLYTLFHVLFIKIYYYSYCRNGSREILSFISGSIVFP